MFLSKVTSPKLGNAPHVPKKYQEGSQPWGEVSTGIASSVLVVRKFWKTNFSLQKISLFVEDATRSVFVVHFLSPNPNEHFSRLKPVHLA